MKYLKKYKLFESEDSTRFSNLKRELEDIVLELSDDGFGVDIDETNYTPPMFSDSIRSTIGAAYCSKLAISSCCSLNLSACLAKNS